MRSQVQVLHRPPGQAYQGVSQSQPTEKPPARDVLSLSEAVDAFLVSWTVAGCTLPRSKHTARYSVRSQQKRRKKESAHWLIALCLSCKPISPACLRGSTPRRYTSTSPNSGPFFGWCVESAMLPEHPIRGLSARPPKTLPRVLEHGAVRRLLLACPDTFEGRRNKALVALLADSGLRISEALRVRIEDLNLAARTVNAVQARARKRGRVLRGRDRTASSSIVLEACDGCERVNPKLGALAIQSYRVLPSQCLPLLVLAAITESSARWLSLTHRQRIDHRVL